MFRTPGLQGHPQLWGKKRYTYFFSSSLLTMLLLVLMSPGMLISLNPKSLGLESHLGKTHENTLEPTHGTGLMSHTLSVP